METELTLEERGALAARALYVQYGYMDDDGVFDSDRAADELAAWIKTEAVVETKDERMTKRIGRFAIVQHLVPSLPPKEQWSPEEAELLGATYKSLDSRTWTLTSESPNGPIQRRLNGDGESLVLVRQSVQVRGEGKLWFVYATRDHKCLVDDIIKPLGVKQEKRAREDAAVAEMLMQRIPEHAKQFARLFDAGTKKAHDQAKAISTASLERALVTAEDDE